MLDNTAEQQTGLCDELKTMTAWGTDDNGNQKWEWCTFTNEVEIWYYDGYWTDSVEFEEDGTTEIVSTVLATVTSTIATHTLDIEVSESSEGAIDSASAAETGNEQGNAFEQSMADSDASDSELLDSSLDSDRDSLESQTDETQSDGSAGAVTLKGNGGGGVLTIFSTISVSDEGANQTDHGHKMCLSLLSLALMSVTAMGLVMP